MFDANDNRREEFPHDIRRARAQHTHCFRHLRRDLTTSQAALILEIFFRDHRRRESRVVECIPPRRCHTQTVVKM